MQPQQVTAPAMQKMDRTIILFGRLGLDLSGTQNWALYYEWVSYHWPKGLYGSDLDYIVLHLLWRFSFTFNVSLRGIRLRALQVPMRRLIQTTETSSQSWRPSVSRNRLRGSDLRSRKSMPCEPFPAIEGWSLSKRAEADCESMDDWVASAAKEDVVSWYLYE